MSFPTRDYGSTTPLTKKQTTALVGRVVARAFDWGVFSRPDSPSEKAFRRAARWLIETGRHGTSTHSTMCAAMLLLSNNHADKKMLFDWEAFNAADAAMSARTSEDVEAVIVTARPRHRITVAAPGWDRRAVAETSLDADGWVVTWPQHGDEAYGHCREFYPYSGGAWTLRADGTKGSQSRGTGDVCAPRSPRRMRTWLASMVRE